MREVLSEIQEWLAQGKEVALATVIRTWGSAPRGVGAKMAVNADGHMVGSVSGGCVEAAVVAEALESLKRGLPKMVHFGVPDATAWAVGLACGGEIDVFVEPLAGLTQVNAAGSSFFEQIAGCLSKDESAVRAVVIQGPEKLLGRSALLRQDGRFLDDGQPGLPGGLPDDARAVLSSASPVSRRYPTPAGEIDVFFEPFLPPPTLVIVGGVHIGMKLAQLSRTLGYRVVIIDPRRAFATSDRFPDIDDIVREWPDEGLRQIGLTRSTAVAVLSHDPKLDDPALVAALRSQAFYVGALGSRKTDEERRERLVKAGLTDDELARLHAPIGLDLGGGSPEEIALSILAEIVAQRASRGNVI